MNNSETKEKISEVVHLGACSTTTEKDMDFLYQNNVNFSKKLWHYCVKREIPFIYASSAATYGDGSKGFDDEIDINQLSPLNKYGYSKQLFDEWVLKQKKTPPNYYGLKFFNVFGPNEYHKGEMSSVLYHAYQQYKTKGRVSLFKSYKKDYIDGEQKRDFIYVKQVVEIIEKLSEHVVGSGIYNIGSGKAKSFKDFVGAMFESMGKKENIEYISMPEELRSKYQYFTEAKMAKLNRNFPFHNKVLVGRLGLWKNQLMIMSKITYLKKILI